MKSPFSSVESLIANPCPVVVALYFRAGDIPALWDLAARHWPDADDVSWFAKAARATERELPIVLECSTKEQVEEAGAFFGRHGIAPPRVEELRID